MSENEKKPQDTTETQPAEAGMPEIPKIEGLASEVKQTGPCLVEVKVTVPAAAIKAEMERAYGELAPNAAIPGFRKGHAPRRLVERHFADAVLEDTKRMLTARAWEQVVKDNDLKPLADPDLAEDQVKYDAEKGLSYELKVEVMPKFDLASYKGLDLTKPPSSVSEEDVTKTLDNLRKRNAALEPVEKGTTQEDDVPVVDVDIKVAGEVVQSVSDQELPLGPDNWLRGLDAEFWKGLLGKKAGESAAKTVTLPETYQKEAYRGKESTVTVTVKDIKRPKLPELNDNFAKDMLYESLDELKKDIRERIGQGKERETQQALSKQVEEKLLGMTEFALPEEMVKSMTANAINRQKMNLAYRGVSRDEIEKATPQIAEGVAKQTERDVRIFFILQQIAEKEGIEVSESEVERRIHVLAQLENQKPAKFREDLRKQGRLSLIRSEIRDEKTIARLIELANVKEGEAPKAEEKPAEKKPAEKAVAEKPVEEAKAEAAPEKEAKKKPAKKAKKE